jgi:pimeloyl-ACP methyl ester carboxylesterase
VPDEHRLHPARRIINGLNPVGNIRLLVTDDGELDAEVTLVLVHGWGSSSTTWATQLGGLVKIGRVIGLDLRGHGGSEAGEVGQSSISQLAADVCAVIELAGGHPVILVGHSMGGNVVSAIAVERPDLVSGVVVIDPAYGADDAELLTVPGRVAVHRRWGAFAPGDTVGGFSADATDAMRYDARHNLLQVPGWILADLVNSIYVDDGAFGHEDDARRYLAHRLQPTLALYPTEARASTERSREHVGTTIVVSPVDSHFLHQERPEWFVDTLSTWISTARDGAIFTS